MKIYIPTPLRPFAMGKDAVEVTATTVAGALDALTQEHPDLRKHLFTSEGKVRAFAKMCGIYRQRKRRLFLRMTRYPSFLPLPEGGLGSE